LTGNNKITEEKDVKHHPALLNLLVQELGCKGTMSFKKEKKNGYVLLMFQFTQFISSK